MLPGINGVELARRLRSDKRTQAIPVIMLTARADEQDKLVVLETGADDYITKPFSPRELNARVKAVLRRRAPQATDDVVESGGLQLDPARHRVSGNGEALQLGPTEFRLLSRNPDKHVQFGPDNMVFCTGQSMPFCDDGVTPRREGTLADAVQLLRAAQMTPEIDTPGYPIIEVNDKPID